VLAVDALHKQVMPFVLRRTKAQVGGEAQHGICVCALHIDSRVSACVQGVRDVVQGRCGATCCLCCFVCIVWNL